MSEVLNNAIKNLACSVVKKAYDDIKDGDDEAVEEVKAGGLDPWLAVLNVTVTPEQIIKKGLSERKDD